MSLPSHFSRRDAMKTLAAATPAVLSAGALVAAASSARADDAAPAAPAKRGVKTGKLKQSVCNWSWGHGLENLCKFCVEYGLTGIDLNRAGTPSARSRWRPKIGMKRSVPGCHSGSW